MSKKQTPKNRQPKQAFSDVLIGLKQPRSEAAPSFPERPSWRLQHLDHEGPWPFSSMSGEDLHGLIHRLASFELMDWHAIPETGSHSINDGICKEAVARLTALKQLDWADSLYSLRINGKCRLWGLKIREVFHVLWWDPEHSVYPVAKK